MRRWPEHLLLGVVAGALVSCGGSNSGSSTIHLRDQTTIVYEGTAGSADEELLCRANGECSSDHIGVMDLAVDGKRIVILASLGDDSIALFVSEDLGVSWATHHLRAPTDRIEDYAGSGGLIASQGRIWLILGGAHEVGNASYGFWQPWEVNLGTNDYAPVMVSAGGATGAMKFDDAHLWVHGSVVSWVYKHPNEKANDANANGDVVWSSVDVATAQTTIAGSVPYTSQDSISIAADWTTSNSEVFTGTLDLRDERLAQCIQTINIKDAQPAIKLNCMPRLYSPIPLEGSSFQFPTVRGMTHFHGGRGHAWATRFGGSPLQVQESLDLGPGTPIEDDLYMGRTRLGSFVSIRPGMDEFDTDGGNRLLRITQTGVDTVQLPRTPCVNDKDCTLRYAWGFGSTLWMLPLGNDDFLMFYGVQAGVDGANKQYLVARKEHATYAAYTPPAPPPVNSPFIAAPDADGGNDLEHMCIRAASCGLELNVYACVENWATVNAAPGHTDHKYETFLQTPPGDCTQFALSYPDKFTYNPPCQLGCRGALATTACPAPGTSGGPTQQDCSAQGQICVEDNQGLGSCHAPYSAPACGTCDGDIAVSCPPSLGPTDHPTVRNCAADGWECRQYNDWDDRTGVARSYAVCSTEELCPVGYRTWCEGSLVHACSSRGDGTITATDDCSRMGLTCTDDKGCDFVGTSCDIGFNEKCQDSYLVYCSASKIHYRDCKAEGFQTCEGTGGVITEAHCK